MGKDRNFTVREEIFNPAEIHHKETIFTIGNGYLSTRGTFEEGFPGERYATLIHGVFDDAPVFFSELANAPNWTSVDIRMAGERFSLAFGQILHYERWLDLSSGLLTRLVRWRSPKGRTSELRFERFASLADPHVLCLRVSITPLDFSGDIEIQAGLNGGEDTLGLLHWFWISQQTADRSAVLLTRTRSTEIQLGIAMRLDVQGGRDPSRAGWDVKNHPTLVAAWKGVQGEALQAEKIVTLFTSRDVEDPMETARQKLEHIPTAGWDSLLAAHMQAWRREWEICDVLVDGDADAQLALRFNIFQLLIAAPRSDEFVSIGAKTLSGFGYRGHAFWDTEIFMLPFFTYTRPEIANNLLSYRWHTLPGARRKAQANGFRGAQYAWESAATGDEVTPTWLLHPRDRTQLVRIWTGDIEIHVSADIVYAIIQYWQATGDDVFMIERGAEIILDTARFWASRAEWNAEKNRYEFNDVIGPDEYHDHVDNNAFTNYIARWHLLKAQELAGWMRANAPEALQNLFQRLETGPGELDRWAEVAAKIYCPFDPKTELIEQFEGYLNRQDVNLADYAGRNESMQFLLGIEGVNQTQVIKQPDVLMLFYLLPELFDEQTVRANYNYYTPRTDHTYGSSLGPAIQAIMACKVGEVEAAYEHFRRAAHADLYDVRGNAGDGIHGASAGGLWQAVVFGFAGLRLTSEGWTTNPQLPDGWKRLAFKFCYHGQLQAVDISA